MVLPEREIKQILCALDSKLQALSLTFFTKRPSGCTLSPEDFIQEARYAAVEAVDHFDEDKADPEHLPSFMMIRSRQRLKDLLKATYNWAGTFVHMDDERLFERLVDTSRSCFTVEDLDLINPLTPSTLEFLSLLFEPPHDFLDFLHLRGKRSESPSESVRAVRDYMGMSRWYFEKTVEEVKAKVVLT